MTALDPCKPIDEPIDGPALPFKYRTSWEVMLFFNLSMATIEKSVGMVCRHLQLKLERHRNGKPDALGNIPFGGTRVAIVFHLSDLPEPREYSNPDAVYDRISEHLKLHSRSSAPFTKIEDWKTWRCLDTVTFGVYEVTSEFKRMHSVHTEPEYMNCGY